jgi:ferredoxin
MLIINPDECIDCDACVALCPVNAIYPESELPDEFAEWLEKNDAELCTDDNRVTETTEAFPEALTMEEIKQREEEQYGYVIEDPSSAAH